jgi:hypothetical protein
VSLLSFLRQYGAREYGVTLAIAAIAGLVIALLINSASGGAGEPALLKTTTEEVAKTAPAPAAPKGLTPVRKARPASHRTARRHHRRRRSHRSRLHRSRSMPVASAAPVIRAHQEPVVSTQPTSATPTPAPVVHPAPAPKPVPPRKPSRKAGGGVIQFDDSG